jgi:molybdopterin-guanine dinucleotide biosynthesis protein A
MIGVVLAGGASSRFGGSAKGLMPLAGRAMALRAADILAQACSDVMIEAPRNIGYEALGLPLLHAPPEHAGKGPLAGLAAGLAAGARVAFAPCDMPLLTSEIYVALVEACGKAPGAYATTTNGVEPLVAVLDADMREALLKALERDELPRTHAILDAAGARALAFADASPFENVNTPGDLERLVRRNFAFTAAVQDRRKSD